MTFRDVECRHIRRHYIQTWNSSPLFELKMIMEHLLGKKDASQIHRMRSSLSLSLSNIGRRSLGFLSNVESSKSPNSSQRQVFHDLRLRKLATSTVKIVKCKWKLYFQTSLSPKSSLLSSHTLKWVARSSFIRESSWHQKESAILKRKLGRDSNVQDLYFMGVRGLRLNFLLWLVVQLQTQLPLWLHFLF